MFINVTSKFVLSFFSQIKDINKFSYADLYDISVITTSFGKLQFNVNGSMGRAELKIEDLAILCEFYNISADYMIGLSDEIKRLNDEK